MECAHVKADRLQRVRAGARMRARNLDRSRSIWSFVPELSDARLWEVIRPHADDLAALAALECWLRERFARHVVDA